MADPDRLLRSRSPRAARARVVVTAVSIAAMLSLGGFLAWRDDSGASTKVSTVGSQATSDSGTGSSGSATAGLPSDDDSSASNRTPSFTPSATPSPHTSTRGS